MSNRLRLRDEQVRAESLNVDRSIWSALTDTPRIRNTEEIEALIERLNHNLNERMANRETITDSVSTLRRIRAAWSRDLHRR